MEGFILVRSFAAKEGKAMRRLIRGLWSGVSGYNHGLRGVADRGRAWVEGFIRVGLESVVIEGLSA